MGGLCRDIAELHVAATALHRELPNRAQKRRHSDYWCNIQLGWILHEQVRKTTFNL